MSVVGYVHGIKIDVDLDKLRVGGSFFVPVLHHRKLVTQLREAFALRDWELAYRVTIEKGLTGVRIWRTK